MKKVVLILALIASLLLIACAAPTAAPQPTTAPQQPAAQPTAVPQQGGTTVVKVGGLYPLTGTDGAAGQTYKKLHEIAVQDINDAGGIACLGGAKLQMVYGDTVGDPEKANTEMERMITQEKVVAVVGSYHSSTALPASEISEKYKVPFVVANALAGSITSRGLKYVFQTIPTLEQWAADDAKFAAEMGAKTAVITVMNIAFGEETRPAWEAGLKANNIQILDSGTYQFGASDLSDTILKVKAKDPDVWFLLANSGDAPLFTRQMQELGYYPKMGIINLGGGFSDPNYIAAVGPKGAEGIFMTGDWFPLINLPGGKEFDAAFQKKAGFGIDGLSQTYASMWLLKDGLEKSCSTDPDKLANVLRTTKFQGGKWNYQWPEVSFDATGKLEQARTVIAQWQNGLQPVVWPSTLATAKPIWPVPGWDARVK